MKLFTKKKNLLLTKGEIRKKTDKCPRCGSKNIDVENGIYYCYNCEYEW